MYQKQSRITAYIKRMDCRIESNNDVERDVDWPFVINPYSSLSSRNRSIRASGVFPEVLALERLLEGSTPFVH